MIDQYLHSHAIFPWWFVPLSLLLALALALAPSLVASAAETMSSLG